jgi:hypothetical protein
VVAMNARHWFSPQRFAVLHPACLAMLAVLMLPIGGASAEEAVPMPAPRPERPGEVAAPAAKDAPVPEERPVQANEAQESESLDPDDVPKPQERPTQPGDNPPQPLDAVNGDDKTAPDKVSKDDDAKVEASKMPLPRPTMMPDEEKACRLRLTELGVAFEERPQLADASGCSAPWPIAVTTLSAGVKLVPDAVMNCAAAERAAAFLKDHIAPKAQSILGSTVQTIRQESAYVCRPRNGTHKLSEHAFGNALDIGAFILKDGRTVQVGGATRRPEGEFMLAVRLAACGPFTTVLGPGSDADHATHFHFDLAKRRPGSAFCQ